MSFLAELKHTLGNEYASVASDGMVGELNTFLDTGSYMLNATISGSIYGGFPSNKIMILGGDPGTGKSFFALSLVQDFLKKNPTGNAIFFESEGALVADTFNSRGMDTTRILVVPVITVQEFRTAATRVLDSYGKLKTKHPMMMVLDSLGMLSTTKEVEDAASGADARDMTRAQLIRGAFRVLSLKMSKLNVPLIATNHVGDKIGSYFPGKVFGGGVGSNYAASTMLMLTKSRDKDGAELIGNIITATLFKSRFTREGLKCKTKLSYSSGLDRYWGLDEIATKCGIWQAGSRITLQDGSKVFAKRIYADPEKYFTPEVLTAIDKWTTAHYTFGHSDDIDDIDPVDALDSDDLDSAGDVE
jgi:RecA/RadA recombinase